jgi:hypothetical protein
MYLRKSRQDDPNETIEEVLAKHERQLQEYAERELGHRIAETETYREIGSGESISERSEIQKVLARLEDPAVIGCLCMEPSRLSRGDLSDCAKIIDTFRFSKSLVATPMMTYNMENKMERKFFQDELLRGNDYLEYTKSILLRGRINSVKGNGAYIGTYPPYGFKKIKMGKIPTLEIIEDEAEVVRLVFDLYVKDGLKPYDIACRLNDMGVNAPRGGIWKKDTIRHMIRNPHYAGYVVFNRIKKTPVLENGKVITKRLAQPEEDVILEEGKHTAIISRETWEAAKRLVARNPRVNHEKELKNPYSGILVCKKCGLALRLHPYKHAEDRLECKQRPKCYKSVKYNVLNDAVIYALENSELPALELRLKNGDGNAHEIQRKLLAKLEKQMEDYRAQEDRQFELLETNPNYSQEVFNRRNAELRQKMEECKAAIYKAKSSLPESVDYAERVEVMKNAISILKDDNATPAEKNKVLKAIVEKIEYSGLPSDGDNKKRQTRTGIDPFNLDITLRL